MTEEIEGVERIPDENTLWLESPVSTILMVTYDDRNKESMERAQAGAILEAELKMVRNNEDNADKIPGLDLRINQIPEFLGKHFIPKGIRLYGGNTRVIFRMFANTEDGLKPCPAPDFGD